jgi:ADP-heptose:LPS heptosyltransferase/predicted O-methyltransferase YrrM
MMAMQPLHVRSMHGLGDCIHERAAVRQLKARGRKIYLETVWPSVYRDLVDENLVLIPQVSSLRTQAANAKREAALYSDERPPPGTDLMSLGYHNLSALTRGTLLTTMTKACGCDPEKADFSLPIHPSWRRSAAALIKSWQPTKPLLIYRPLIERKEWEGCTARNPDHAAYATLFRSIADQFFIVSVADLMPGVEEIVGEQVPADVRLHHGEADVGTLAALMARAALVYSSPGFAMVMAMAVGTPLIGVFGGFENARIWTDSALYSPFLGINPIEPCICFRHDHACKKEIDIASALPEVRRFAEMAARENRPIGPRKVTSYDPPKWVRPNVSTRFMNPGELERIIGLVASVKPERVIEFGCNDGRTALAILSHVPKITEYIGIDVPAGFQTKLPIQRAEVIEDPGRLVHGDRRFKLLTPPNGSRDLGHGDLPPCDAVFIDGDHSREGVLHDTYLAKGVIRKGGIIIWHDDHPFGTVDVRDVLDEMHAYGEVTPLHIEGTWMAYEVAK